MSKLGLFLLSICAGIVIGLLLGYTFFHTSGTKSPSATAGRTDTPGTHQYFYRLNDSLAARHTVGGADSSILHRVDTVAIESR